MSVGFQIGSWLILIIFNDFGVRVKRKQERKVLSDEDMRALLERHEDWSDIVRPLTQLFVALILICNIFASGLSLGTDIAPTFAANGFTD